MTFLNRILFLVFFLSLLFPTIDVNAHSNLEKTFPKDSIQLEDSPSTLEAWFQDPVQIHSNSFSIKDQHGKSYQIEKPSIDPENKGHVIAKLKNPLPPNTYKVDVNTIALDGYVSTESYRFEIVTKEKEVEKHETEVKLLKASPSDGETIKGAVDTLDLWFNQPVKISVIGVFDDQKRGLVKKDIIDPNDPNHILLKFEDNLATGTYQVSWFVQPLKGNTLSERMGVFYFTVNKFSAINPPEGTPSVDWLTNINMKQMSYWLSFLGFSILFGFAWFNHYINKAVEIKRWRILSIMLFVIAALGEVSYLVVFRNEISELPLEEFFTIKFAWIPVLQIGLIALGLLSQRFNLYFFGLSLLLFSFVVGHSSYPRYGGILAMGINSVHLLATSIWIGGLFGLIFMAPRKNRIAWFKINARKFSRWALGSALLIILTGIWMTFNFVPSFSIESFTQSVWGRTIVIKVILLLCMIGIAYSLQNVIKHLSDQLLNGFNIRLKTEFLFGLIVLFFAGILVVSTPSAAEQGIYPSEMKVDDLQLKVDISPLYPGHNVISLRFDQEKVKNTTVRFIMPPDYEKTNKAFQTDKSTFKLTGMNLHAAGTMYMEVVAEKQNGEVVTFPFKVVVPGEVRFNE